MMRWAVWILGAVGALVALGLLVLAALGGDSEGLVSASLAVFWGIVVMRFANPPVEGE